MSPRNNYPRASYGGRGNCWVIVLKRRARTLPTNTPVGAGINSTAKHNHPTRQHWPDSTGQTVLVRQCGSPGGGQTVLVGRYWSDSLGLGVLARQYRSDSAGHTVRGHGPAVPEGHKVLAVVDHPPPFGRASAPAPPLPREGLRRLPATASPHRRRRRRRPATPTHRTHAWQRSRRCDCPSVYTPFRCASPSAAAPPSGARCPRRAPSPSTSRPLPA